MSFCIVHTIHHFPAFVCWIYIFQKERFFEVGNIPRICSGQVPYDTTVISVMRPVPQCRVDFSTIFANHCQQRSDLHCLWLIPQLSSECVVLPRRQELSQFVCGVSWKYRSADDQHQGRLLDCGRCDIASPDGTWLFVPVESPNRSAGA